MRLLCRQAWSRLAFLAILAAIAGVLAACGAGPGAKARPDPVKIKDVVFEKVGIAREIPLGDKFSGEELTYTATVKQNKPVVTVEVDNDEDILTVTAVGAGEATITVTAADSQKRTASQTFKVTVKATTSEPEPGAPTVKDGAPTSVDFEAGESTTKTVTLSQVFEGDDLTYSAPESDDTDVAIVSISNGRLIIRAGDSGEATITVTATNAKGSVAHEITVTVPEPVTATETPPKTQPTTKHSNCPSPLEITRGGNRKCTLTKGHSLVYSVPAGEKERVRVSKPASATENVWTITAIRKGRPVVQIRDDETGDKVDEITVIVPNTSPRLENTAGLGPLTLGNATELGYHEVELRGISLATTFTDDDDVDKADDGKGKFNYKVGYTPDELLIKTVRGFLLEDTTSDDFSIKAVVLKSFTEEVPIELYAYDQGNDRSDSPVTVKFAISGSTPRSGNYTVTQNNNGDFVAVRLGNRLDVDHTLTFEEGFKFADNWDRSLTEGESNHLADKTITLNPATGECMGNNTPTTTTLSAVGEACYTHTPGNNNKVEVGTLSIESSGNGEVAFQLPSEHNGLNSGTGTITIYYHVRAYESKYMDDAAPGDAKEVIKTTRKRLTLNIHKCVVATDCPIDSDS